jgi:hypothetical protein
MTLPRGKICLISETDIGLTYPAERVLMKIPDLGRGK